MSIGREQREDDADWPLPWGEEQREVQRKTALTIQWLEIFDDMQATTRGLMKLVREVEARK